MANVYTTSSALSNKVGAARLAALQDRDGDGSVDANVLTEAIEEAGRLINMRLRQRYGSAVPFAQITDDPATPEEIQEIAARLVLWQLYDFFEPNGRDSGAQFKLADASLTGLADGTFDIDVARAGASEGRYIAVYEAADPTISGVDSSDQDRLTGI
jgi:hypothetical protein